MHTTLAMASSTKLTQMSRMTTPWMYEDNWVGRQPVLVKSRSCAGISDRVFTETLRDVPVVLCGWLLPVMFLIIALWRTQALRRTRRLVMRFDSTAARLVRKSMAVLLAQVQKDISPLSLFTHSS